MARRRNRRRYPEATFKRGQWTTVTEIHAVLRAQTAETFNDATLALTVPDDAAATVPRDPRGLHLAGERCPRSSRCRAGDQGQACARCRLAG